MVLNMEIFEIALGLVVLVFMFAACLLLVNNLFFPGDDKENKERYRVAFLLLFSSLVGIGVLIYV